MRVFRGNIDKISFTDLLAGLSEAKFSGRLTLNEGEHFCIIDFFKGNITGAFGWKLEGDNAILHLLLEKENFNFSLPKEIEIPNDIDFKRLPRGTKHVIDLIVAFENDFPFFIGGLQKSIVLNDTIDSDIDLTSNEMFEIMRFTNPVPVSGFIGGELKKNLYEIKKFFDRHLLVIKD